MQKQDTQQEGESIEDLNAKLKEDIKKVLIDPEGIYKYVQILILPKNPNDLQTGKEKYLIVRGFKECREHSDVFQKFFINELKANSQLNSKYYTVIQGGGRIDHDSANKKIQIYGYSNSFGIANHKLTKKLVQEEYPDCEVTWSNNGY